MSNVIRFTSVSKKYTLNRHKARSVQNFFTGAFNRRNTEDNSFWVLQNIDFTVNPGESIALVGPNGAGKSTILKLISAIITPTTGTIEVNGRVSSLLELGTGFHPDLTGRENVYLNGSILGLSNKAIDGKYDQIVDFAEIGEFIDLPVKHYSSGMYLRLAFAVAIHVEPDILLVDEALSVGDQLFQQKCLERIGRLKRDGVTFILVSHSLGAVLNLCDRVLWLKDGQIEADDKASVVVDQYLVFMNERYQARKAVEQQDLLESDSRWGTREAEITHVELLNSTGMPSPYFKTGQKFQLRIHYQTQRQIELPTFGLAFFRNDGLHINGPNSVRDGFEISYIEGKGYVDYVIKSLPLNTGRYELTVAIYDYYSTIAYDHHHRMYSFEVKSTEAWREEGVVHITADWSHQPVVAPQHSSQITNVTG